MCTKEVHRVSSYTCTTREATILDHYLATTITHNNHYTLVSIMHNKCIVYTVSHLHSVTQIKPYHSGRGIGTIQVTCTHTHIVWVYIAHSSLCTHWELLWTCTIKTQIHTHTVYRNMKNSKGSSSTTNLKSRGPS